MLGADMPFPVSILAIVAETLQQVSELSTNCMPPNKSELMISYNFRFILFICLFFCFVCRMFLHVTLTRL